MSGFRGGTGTSQTRTPPAAAWALASAIYAATVGAALRRAQRRPAKAVRNAPSPGSDTNSSARAGAVPRPLSRGSGVHGGDANEVTLGASDFLLNLAPTMQRRRGPRRGGDHGRRRLVVLEPTTGLARFATETYGTRCTPHDHLRPALRLRIGRAEAPQRGGKWRGRGRQRPNTRGTAHDAAGRRSSRRRA